ncbi:MAG: hypothetical protein GC186_09370 [Rhodobacteraceae bacterium]|nr:hypothetical protein [Paracoccaceae bacterium]
MALPPPVAVILLPVDPDRAAVGELIRVAATRFPALGPDDVTLDCNVPPRDLLIAPHFQLHYSLAATRAMVGQFHVAEGQADPINARITDASAAHLQLEWKVPNVNVDSFTALPPQTVRYTATYVFATKKIILGWDSGNILYDKGIPQTDGSCAPTP